MKLGRILSQTAAAASLVALPRLALAQVPADYTGTPFMGTPWPVPGRIDFENYDDGGQGVGWSVDDHTGNFGVGGCGGNLYREDMPHPQICVTNAVEGDVYSAGANMGMPYPLDGSESMYIGYTHGVDWVKLTVDVKQAGTYTLSSTWASEGGGADGIKMQISMNDVLVADVSLDGTGGYHNWVDFTDFATVELQAGVQVLQFAAKSQHLNYDYLQLTLQLPGGGTDDGSGNAGAAGSGGMAGAGGDDGIGPGGAAGAPSGGVGGASAGAAGAAEGGQVGALGGSGGTAGTGDTSSAAGSAGAAGATAGGDPGAAAPMANGGDVNTDSGCAIASAPRSRSFGLLLAMGFAALAWAQRRRR